MARITIASIVEALCNTDSDEEDEQGLKEPDSPHEISRQEAGTSKLCEDEVSDDEVSQEEAEAGNDKASKEEAEASKDEAKRKEVSNDMSEIDKNEDISNGTSDCEMEKNEDVSNGTTNSYCEMDNDEEVTGTESDVEGDKSELTSIEDEESSRNEFSTSESESMHDDEDENISPDDIPLPKKKTTRKRKRQPDRWTRNRRKRRRNLGKSYTSTASKKVPPKQPSNIDSCGCSRQCFTKISQEIRKTLFDGFWTTGSFDIQNTYICGCIKTTKVKRRYGADKKASRRAYTREYYLKDGAESIQVCKVAFRSILSISDGRINRALKAQVVEGGSPHSDKRGRHVPANKTTESRKSFVREHIESFPKYKSHYSRKDNPYRSYLSPTLSLLKMYELYKIKCEEKSEVPVSQWTYRRIFNTEYNLNFGSPKSDTCKVCDSMKIKLEAENDPHAKVQIEAEWNLHKIRAQSTYQKLNEDSAYAKSHRDTEMLTFNLEKSLPTPELTTGIVYYKRQLWTYNLGIHDCSTNVGCMHMWNESTASRGSHEVGSCVLVHLKEMNTSATNLVLYSDSCGGQNRNINIVCMWLHVVSSDEYPFTSIQHKFMVSGHSYLPNDWDFGNIELARKKTDHIFIPEDWERVISQARRKNPFIVRRMEQDDFVSLKSLKQAIVNRKVNTQGRKVEWLKMQWISVEKDKPLQFRYRYSNNELEVWKTVNLKRKTKGRPPDMGKVHLDQLYNGPRKVNALKIKDLMELLKFIPPIHHQFYKELCGNDRNDSCSDPSEASDSENE